MQVEITYEQRTWRKVRAQFERWFSDDGKSPKAIERDDSGNYKLGSAAWAWTAWQAAAKVERQACAEICDEVEAHDCSSDTDAF